MQLVNVNKVLVLQSVTVAANKEETNTFLNSPRESRILFVPSSINYPFKENCEIKLRC